MNEHVKFIASLTAAMANGLPFYCDAGLKHHKATAEFRRHIIRIEPNRAKNETICSWTGTSIDIEDRKQAEDALSEQEQHYQRERKSSTAFQRAALPLHLPVVAGLSFDALYEPGLIEAQIGGDWYDAVRLLDGRVVVTIGDVAGHGLNAAVIMGVVRQILRGIAQLHAEPVMMLDAADRALRLEYPDVIVTAWVGNFDLVDHTLTYASAGHPPPLLLDLSGEVQELDHLTLPIGLRQSHQGHASHITLSYGSTLWLYTDGLIEASHDLLAGSKCLLETARALISSTSAHPAETIRRLVIPDGSADDVAILVIKTNFHESEKCLTRERFDSADAFAASNARRAFAKSLSPDDFTEVDIANAEVVFGELCSNVARYAPGIIDIIVDKSGVQVILHVLDRGGGFQHLSRLPHDALSESGRGLFIIASMTAEFTVTERIGGGSAAHAVLVGRYPISLLRDETLPAVTDQIALVF